MVLATGALAACAYVYVKDPSQGGTFIPCPFHTLTGLWCPGCGMTRAAHHLLHGDIAGTLSRNLFLPLVLVVAVWAWIAWTAPSVGRSVPGPNAVPRQVWYGIGVALLVFGVVRNLPFGAALAP